MQCLRCFITSYFAWNTAITVHWHCELYHLALNLGNVDILGILAMALLFWERYPWREYICSKLLLGIEGAITFVTDYHTTYMMCSIFLHCSVVITFFIFAGNAQQKYSPRCIWYVIFTSWGGDIPSATNNGTSFARDFRRWRNDVSEKMIKNIVITPMLNCKCLFHEIEKFNRANLHKHRYQY